MLNWITYLQSTNLSQVEKAAYSLLADLSCSPWKFELLWDCWPHLKDHTASRKGIPRELASLGNPQLMAFGHGVFDAVAIFSALLGNGREQPSRSRGAYKCAFMSLRPALSRTVFGAPPFQLRAVHEDNYLTHLAFARACTSDADLEAAYLILSQTSERSRARGKDELANVCKQNIRELQILQKELLPGGASEFVAQKAFHLALSVSDACLLREFLMQWSPLFDGSFMERSGFWTGQSHEDGTLRNLKSVIEQVRSAAALVNETPAVDTIAAALLFARELSHYQPPPWLGFLPPDWLARSQESLSRLTANSVSAPLVRAVSTPAEPFFAGSKCAGVHD